MENTNPLQLGENRQMSKPEQNNTQQSNEKEEKKKHRTIYKSVIFGVEFFFVCTRFILILSITTTVAVTFHFPFNSQFTSQVVLFY